jgi:hypothetical protein
MNVEIGAEAALFPDKEYRKGIFVAVYINFHFPSAFWGKFPYILGNLRKLSSFSRNM